MDSIQNKVYYCCVSKGNNVLYVYGGGDQEVEKVAVLCLERAPPFHRWYFETIGKRTFGFFLVFGYCLSLCFLVGELPYRELERRIGVIP